MEKVKNEITRQLDEVLQDNVNRKKILFEPRLYEISTHSKCVTGISTNE
jgi:hypothetical protein